MTNDIPTAKQNGDSFLNKFNRDPKIRNIAIYSALGLVIFFLIAASLAPNLGKNLGLLSLKKNSQKSFAAEETGTTKIENTAKGWVSSFSSLSSGNDYVKSLATDREGNVYLSGSYFHTTSQNSDILLRKYSPTGEVIWTQTEAGTDNIPDAQDPADMANKIRLDSSGNLIVVGYQSHKATKKDAWIAKFSQDGQKIWSKEYNGSPSGDDTAMDAALDRDGNIYVVGTQKIPDLGSDILVLKYSSTGNLLWQKTITTKAKINNNVWPGNDTGTAVALTKSGEIYIGGNMDYSPEDKNQKAYLAKIDPNGNTVWETTEDEKSQASALATDSQNNVYLAGGVISKEQNNDQRMKGFIKKYSSDKQLLASQTFESPIVDIYSNLQNSIFAVATQNQGQVSLVTVSKYDTNLNQSSSQTYSPQPEGLNLAAAVISDSKGNVYVGLDSEVKGERSNIVLVKYTSL